MMKKHFKKHKIILLVLILLLAGIFLSKNLIKNNQPASQPSNSKSSVSSTPVPLPEDYSLEIGPQDPGTIIVLDKVGMLKMGWLVLYSNDGGKIGQVLEEAIPPLTQGTTEKAVLFLKDPLVSGQKYFVQIQNTPDDAPVKNSKGENVLKEFIVK